MISKKRSVDSYTDSDSAAGAPVHKPLTAKDESAFEE